MWPKDSVQSHQPTATKHIEFAAQRPLRDKACFSFVRRLLSLDLTLFFLINLIRFKVLSKYLTTTVIPGSRGTFSHRQHFQRVAPLNVLTCRYRASDGKGSDIR